ncbi:hypothetical protein [Leifsonia sp. Root112D2]|uniref:hypothetical protein n=1 Tax=Leifsonia sp. Root112D2 TaxID=1736426 RepID=UPI000700F55F|nr:hypothetical protein [Leifsonia sp. Root112D2]KQV07229.1 hypothetical protein ASC63_07915 [Leifsonia sp. Root112D2]
MRNSSRVRDQPALTTSSGKSWLIMGALLAIISVIVLIPLMQREPRAVAVIGVIAVVVLYAVIVVARLLVGPGRLRLGIMAIAMLCMAASALTCVLIIAGAQPR